MPLSSLVNDPRRLGRLSRRLIMAYLSNTIITPLSVADGNYAFILFFLGDILLLRGSSWGLHCD